MTTIHSAIQALLSSAALEANHLNHRPPKPVIALSRDHGALGRQIADGLSQRLGVPVYDREILAKVAERLNTDPQTLKMLDECVARARDMWLVRLFTGQELTEDAYRTHLVNVILSLGRVGGILLGRGANVVLATSCALRVRITASPEVCTQRVMARYHVSEDEARQQISEINANRGRFVWEMFHRRNSDASNFDLIINTDRFTDVEPVVDLLEKAYRAIELQTAHADTGKVHA